MSRLAEEIRGAAWRHGSQLRTWEIAEKAAREIADELAPTDDEIRALVRSVAQATVEMVAEDFYLVDSKLWAERARIAERVADATMECADEDPESEVHAMRRMR